jgi:hypothetical protein
MSCFDGLIFTNYTEEEGLLSNAVFDMQWWNDTLTVSTKLCKQKFSYTGSLLKNSNKLI